MKPSRSFRKKLLSASVASVLGLSASGLVNATTYELSFTGAFTMLNSVGAPVLNNPSPYVAYGYAYGWYGNRTPITGVMNYDTATGTGTLTINGFHFFGNDDIAIAQAHDVSIQAIGNGTCTNDDPAQGCQPGNLLLGNMLFHWNLSDPDYAVPNVWDAQGLLAALPTANLGDVIQGVGAVPASSGINFGTNKAPILLPLGATPIANTTWNTTPNGNTSLTLTTSNCGMFTKPDTTQEFSCAGVQNSGILPLVADTVGASPIIGTGFSSFSANFDIRTLTVTCKDSVCLSTPPNIATRLPGPNAANVDVRTALIFSFTKSMQAATVASAFSLKVAGGATVAGTLSPSSGNATSFTFTPAAPLDFVTSYTATITSAAQDINNLSLNGAPVAWNFTTAAPTVGPSCTTTSQVPVGSNFTMLNPSGSTFTDGTNDVAYAFIGFDPDNIQAGDLNASASDTKFNMTITSVTPWPFFGKTWTAHHVRVFGPGTYVFNSGCTSAELETGTPPASCGVTGANVTMTVGDGQLGAHMLFNWNQATDIDVVNVWSRNAAWNRNPLNLDPAPKLGVNDVFTGPAWGGPDGVTVNMNTTWKFVSTDPDGDGFNGVKMVDGPFEKYIANFNLGAADSCLGVPKTPISVSTVSSSSSTGCSLSTKPSSITVFERSDWLLVGGFLAWLGALRFRIRRSAKA